MFGYRPESLDGKEQLDAKFIADVGVGTLAVVHAVHQDDRMRALARKGLQQGDLVRFWGGRLDLVSLTFVE